MNSPEITELTRTHCTLTREKVKAHGRKRKRERNRWRHMRQRRKRSRRKVVRRRDEKVPLVPTEWSLTAECRSFRVGKPKTPPPQGANSVETRPNDWEEDEGAGAVES